MGHHLRALACLPLLLGGCAGYADEQERRETEIFVQVRRLIDTYYVDEIDRSVHFEAAMGAIMSRLDPRSRLIVGEHANANWGATSYHYLLGHAVADTPDALVVLHALGDGAQDLLPGDRITSINGTPMAELLDPARARRSLWHPRSDGVNVGVEREGEPALSFDIPVNQVIHPPVWWPRLLPTAGDIGYLHLSHLPVDDAHVAVRAAVSALRARGARGLVLDLRWCPGGDVSETVRVGNLFMPGAVIMNLERKVSGDALRTAPGLADFSDLPVVALVNGHTASGGEALAGALQDHDAGVLVGTRTYGKGSGQGSFTLDAGAHLTLTTIRWTTPKGRSADADTDGERGLKPDVEVVLDEAQELRLRRAVTTPPPTPADEEAVAAILARLGRAPEFGPLLDHDPQLQRAVIILRRRLREGVEAVGE